MQTWLDAGEASAIVLARVLAVDLDVDDRRRLPRRLMGRLIPVLFALLRFPALRTDSPACRAALAHVVLRLALHPDHCDHPLTTEACSREILECGYADEAIETLIRHSTFVSAELVADVRAADNLQSAYLDLLYWLLRHRKACDLPFDDPSRSRLLDSSDSPERQHIIPFSRVEYPPGHAIPKRSSRAPVNSIGNFTFISATSNSATKGWSNRFMKVDPRHAHAHFIDGDDLDAYRAIATRYDKGNVTIEDLVVFQAQRTERIAQAFLSWQADLGEGRTELPRTRWAERRPNLLDALMRWGYPTRLALKLDRRLRTWPYEPFARRTNSARWRTDARTRIRWTSDERWADLRSERQEVSFEVRLAGQDSSCEENLTIGATHLRIPTSGTTRVFAAADLKGPLQADAVAALEDLLPAL
jgi:hypothetical protein